MHKKLQIIIDAVLIMGFLMKIVLMGLTLLTVVMSRALVVLIMGGHCKNRKETDKN